MKNLFLGIFFLFFGWNLNAQFYNEKNLMISQTFQFYNEKSLNNKYNFSNKTAHCFQLEMVSKIKPVLSLNKGLGIGVNNNISETKTLENGYSYFRAIGGLKLHLPHNETETKKNALNPFLFLNYHLDFFHIQKNKFTVSNLNYGLGSLFSIKNNLGIVLKASHHQELGLEFRTFYSFNLGVIAGL